MKKHISIIGAGFSSLASACYLAKAGYNVEIFEKNNHLGGRAKVLEQDDFKFDIKTLPGIGCLTYSKIFQ